MVLGLHLLSKKWQNAAIRENLHDKSRTKSNGEPVHSNRPAFSSGEQRC